MSLISPTNNKEDIFIRGNVVFFFSILMGLLFIGPIVHLKIEKKKNSLLPK